MIAFFDGPAQGTTLNLRRAPYFLRVVVDEDGSIDALDQLDDVIRETETAYVYVLDGEPSIHGFVCSRGANKGCRRLLDATYRLYDEQPDDDVLRDNAAWVEWALREGNALTVRRQNGDGT